VLLLETDFFSEKRRVVAENDERNIVVGAKARMTGNMNEIKRRSARCLCGMVKAVEEKKGRTTEE
jgi:hypothetical protein